MSTFLDRARSTTSAAARAMSPRRWRASRATPDRVKTPTVLQMEAVECGAAALGTILAYHGRYEPLEALRTKCGVSRDGSKASNMLKAARTYGLDAKGFKVQPDTLKEEKPPMIIHWNFNHFVVLEGFKDDVVYLNDPAHGPKTVDYQEFDESFTGVVLKFEKGEDFEPGGQKQSVIGSLKRRFESSSQALLFVVLAGLALVVPGLLEPTFQKVFVDNVLIRGLSDWAKPTLFAMGGTVLFYAALLWLRQQHLLRMEMKLALTTSGKFFWHVLQLPVVFYTQRSSGDIGSRVMLNDRIARLLSRDLASNALNVIVILFYGILMFTYDGWLTFIVFVVAVLNVVALQFVARRRTDLNQRLQQERGKLTGMAMGGLQSIKTVKATGGESDFFTRWAGHHTKVVNAQQELGLQTQLLSVVPPLLVGVSLALVLGIGGFRIMEGYLTIGMLIGFQVLMSSFLSPVGQMVTLGSKMQEVQGDMRRLDDVLQNEIDPAIRSANQKEEHPDRPPIRSRRNSPNREGKQDREDRNPSAAKLNGFLELRNVTFGYSPLEAPLIEDFNLSLTPGMRVALVGGSGSGKSTIARLVCGLYEPWEGDILFDKTPRSDVNRNSLINSFSVVDQQISLFEDTVRNNLTLWDTTIPTKQIVQAARDACIHEEITSRQGGYERVLDEDGRNFSGGQRQRLEIARALTCNPSIMVLDEATSALDPTTEKEIDDNLRRRGCTCLIIAHRLSTIRDCDEIVVLDEGRVIQRGTHQELSATDGAYLNLLDSM